MPILDEPCVHCGGKRFNILDGSSWAPASIHHPAHYRSVAFNWVWTEAESTAIPQLLCRYHDECQNCGAQRLRSYFGTDQDNRVSIEEFDPDQSIN